MLGSEVRSADGSIEGSTRRRRFLAALGTVGAVAVAGCSAGGGGGGDGGGTPDGGGGGGTGDGEATGTTTGSGGDGGGPNCRDLTSGYRMFDPGRMAIVFRGEAPTAFGSPMFRGVDYTSAKTVFVDFGDSFTDAPSLRIEQPYAKYGVFEEPPSYSNWETVTEIEFNGETRPVVEVTGSASAPTNVNHKVHVPYEIDGTTYYFLVDMTWRAPAMEDSEACGNAVNEAATHLSSTIEPNPKTTIAEEFVR